LPQSDHIFCQRCYREGKGLHIHHINPDQGVVSEGGWQTLIIHEEQFEEGVPMAVLCKKCHQTIHNNRV